MATTSYNKRSSIPFWIIFIILSCIATVFSFYYFPRAFPLVTINLSMDRSQALEKSNTLIEGHHWGPEQAQITASFQTDVLVKTFVELEAGGKDALVAMMQQKLYQPYTWQTRYFKQFDPHEVTIRFTPEGDPYGFLETLSENSAGPDLTTQQAQTIAEQALPEWNINLSDYQLVETSKDIKPSGRSDHLFVYQRPIKIGEGFYRLRLQVSGDKLTELTHLVQVPEAFLLRYQHMRSANTSIASAANIALQILYIMIGCIIGLFILMRSGWVLWRVPLIMAILIAGLEFLAGLNELPLAWMYYDTALPWSTFLLQYIISHIYLLMYSFFTFLLSFMAAESLSRKAFGNHVQLWRVWSPSIANSSAIASRTVGGYLLVPFMFAYVVALYVFAQRYLGWWTPSEQLLDPNVLANYVPWFSSLAIAFKAGFWEECLFRAVPLAGAALLGRYFGKQTWWVVGAFILQAIIFGAAHANYPAQPAYARLVELILPSFMFGGIYLAYGLVTAIITHVIYDVVWMSLPLFISTAAGAWINQLIVITISLVPLWVIAYWYLRTKQWNTAYTAYNKAWQPLQEQESVSRRRLSQIITSFSAQRWYAIIGLGVIGTLFWFSFTYFTQYAPPLTSNRQSAYAHALEAIEKEFAVSLDSSWTQLSNVQEKLNTQVEHRFIWQQGGKDLYKDYLQSYLMPPHWIIRSVKFTGPIVERAEEYRLYIGRNGTVIRATHTLPEARPGVHLEEAQARVIAQKALQEHFNIDSNQVKEISATAFKRPERKDWTFEFVDTQKYPLKEGQARIAISIAGDQVNDVRRYIHAPEEWERAERGRTTFAQLMTMLCSIIVYMLFLLGLSFSLVRWSANRFPARIFLYNFIFLFALSLIILFNNWPQIISLFNTSEPFNNQVFKLFGMTIVSILIKSAVVALVVALTFGLHRYCKLSKSLHSLIGGILAGLGIIGFYALLNFMSPSVEALWAQYTALGTIFYFIAPTTTLLYTFIIITALFLLMSNAVDHLSHNWQKNIIISLLLLVIFTLVITGLQVPNHVISWLITGTLFGIIISCVYYFIIRFDHAMIPIVVGTFIIAQTVQQALFNAFPGAFVAYSIAACVIGLAALGWWKKLL
jgi:membrane protease YdiL (CAAX protease family)